eukprot:Lankesteria_metandrocarpae@DN3925_c0_g1_i1.p1
MSALVTETYKNLNPTKPQSSYCSSNGSRSEGVLYCSDADEKDSDDISSSADDGSVSSGEDDNERHVQYGIPGDRASGGRVRGRSIDGDSIRLRPRRVEVIDHVKKDNIRDYQDDELPVLPTTAKGQSLQQQHYVYRAANINTSNMYNTCDTSRVVDDTNKTGQRDHDSSLDVGANNDSDSYCNDGNDDDDVCSSRCGFADTLEGDGRIKGIGNEAEDIVSDYCNPECPFISEVVSQEYRNTFAASTNVFAGMRQTTTFNTAHTASDDMTNTTTSAAVITHSTRNSMQTATSGMSVTDASVNLSVPTTSQHTSSIATGWTESAYTTSDAIMTATSSRSGSESPLPSTSDGYLRTTPSVVQSNTSSGTTTGTDYSPALIQTPSGDVVSRTSSQTLTRCRGSDDLGCSTGTTRVGSNKLQPVTQLQTKAAQRRPVDHAVQGRAVLGSNVMMSSSSNPLPALKSSGQHFTNPEDHNRFHNTVSAGGRDGCTNDSIGAAAADNVVKGSGIVRRGGRQQQTMVVNGSRIQSSSSGTNFVNDYSYQSELLTAGTGYPRHDNTAGTVGMSVGSDRQQQRHVPSAEPFSNDHYIHQQQFQVQQHISVVNHDDGCSDRGSSTTTAAGSCRNATARMATGGSAPALCTSTNSLMEFPALGGSDNTVKRDIGVSSRSSQYVQNSGLIGQKRQDNVLQNHCSNAVVNSKAHTSNGTAAMTTTSSSNHHHHHQKNNGLIMMANGETHHHRPNAQYVVDNNRNSNNNIVNHTNFQSTPRSTTPLNRHIYGYNNQAYHFRPAVPMQQLTAAGSSGACTTAVPNSSAIRFLVLSFPQNSNDYLDRQLLRGSANVDASSGSQVGVFADEFFLPPPPAHPPPTPDNVHMQRSGMNGNGDGQWVNEDDHGVLVGGAHKSGLTATDSSRGRQHRSSSGPVVSNGGGVLENGNFF